MVSRLESAFPTASRQKTNWRLFPSHYLAEQWRARQTAPYYISIEQFLEFAAESLPHLDIIGQDLAHRLGGHFALGPLKTYERVEQQCNILNCSPSYITDYTRGVVLLDNLHDVIRARKKIRDWTNSPQSTIAESIDRYSQPNSGGLRGIFLSIVLPNGHIAEIQVHLKAYWEALQNTHSLYQRKRNLEDDKFRYEVRYFLAYEAYIRDKEFEIPKEWTDEHKRVLKRVRQERHIQLDSIANTTGVKILELASRNFKGDCSYPVRPIIASQNGQLAYLIASESLSSVIIQPDDASNEWWDPKWQPNWDIK